jgi:hypothetical protein
MIINTNLEKEFNLNPLILEESTEKSVEESALEMISESGTIEQCKELDKIDYALPQVWGLESTDKELDDIAEKAIQSYQDLMELSMNIDQKYCGDVSGAAATMLGHAITARTNKIKKKLDIITLQIKKQLADHKTKTVDTEPEELEGKGTVLDRNELLRHLLGKDK